MQRLIDANEILKSEHQHYDYMSDEYYVLVRDIENAPTVDAEPTEEQVKEHCRKRCLVIVTNELFNEMKARWSAEPVRHGHWDDMGDFEECSVCHGTHLKVVKTCYGKMTWVKMSYCPFCGAKMDEVV